MSGEEIKSKDLLEAIQKDRVKEVEARLALGENVDYMFPMNRTGLHCATSNSNVKMVEILLKANADISTCDSNGNTSLHIACSRSGPDSFRIVQILLESGQTLPLEKRNNFNRSPLEESILIGNVESAKMLLEMGASVPTSSITLAVQENNEEMVKVIKAANNNNASGPVLQSPSASIQLSAKEEREALLKRLGELDAQETGDLESQLGAKKKDFEKMKTQYAKEKKETKVEIDKLENQLHELKSKMAALIKEEDKETRKMKVEMSTLSNDIDKRKLESKPNMDLAGLLECPICTDIIKPPLQIWQCPEGHTICETCSNRPELEVCPQCRMNLQGRMSRCRVLEELSRRSFPSENIETPNDTRDQNQNDRVEEPPNPPSRNQSIRNLGYIFRQRTPDDFNFEDLTSDFYRINNDDEETVVVEEDIDDWTDEENEFTSSLREVFGYNDASPGFFPRHPPHWERLQRTPSRGQPRRRSPGSLRVGHSSSTLTSNRGGGSGHDEGMERLYVRDGRPSYSRGTSDRSGRRNSGGRVRGQWGRPQDLRYLR